MNGCFRFPSLILILVLAAPAAHAHRAWLYPSATVLAGEESMITVDGAVSNDLFHTDYVALRLEGLRITGPDGGEIEPVNSHTGRFRSVFDVPLAEPGTYRIAVASHGLAARWTDADGERQFYPGRGERPDPEEFARRVPSEAADLEVSENSRRMETFVTLGAPTDPAGIAELPGLVLQPVSHPNDLYAGEKSRFRLLIDGKPAKGAEVTVLAGGMRYRNAQDAIEQVADEAGEFSIAWPDAGMYWLEANYEDDRARAPATRRRGSYSVTLEVFPQ